MKRIDNLYDKIISVENLRRADEKARRGKTHTHGVQLHDANRKANIMALHEALQTQTFTTSEYSVFTIYEPKERLIYRLPYYPDRILHHAIMNVLEPIWVSVFPYNTYSCIKGRGIHGAMKRVKRIIRAYVEADRPLYCLKIDIRKYYPSIPHASMKRIVRRKIKCERTLWLIDNIIDSINGSPDPSDNTKVCDGHSLPIGNYLSQFLANLFLAYLVHRIIEEFPEVDNVWYADDGTFFSDDKELLRRVKEFVDVELQRLGVRMKDNWQIFPIAENHYDRKGRGLDFLGFVFYRNQTLIRKSTKKNFCRAAARLNRRRKPLSQADYKTGICSWLGWAKYSNSQHLLKTIIKPQYQNGILRRKALNV